MNYTSIRKHLACLGVLKLCVWKQRRIIGILTWIWNYISSSRSRIRIASHQLRVRDSTVRISSPVACLSTVPKNFYPESQSKSQTSWLQSCFIHISLIWREVVLPQEVSVLEGLSRNGPLVSSREPLSFHYDLLEPLLTLRGACIMVSFQCDLFHGWPFRLVNTTHIYCIS